MMKMEDETVLTTSAKVARLPCPDAATKKFVEAQRKLFAVGELAQWKIDWLERIPGWSWCDPNDVGKTQTPKWSTYKRKSKAVCETTLPFLEEIRANPDFGGFRDLAETAEKTKESCTVASHFLRASRRGDCALTQIMISKMWMIISTASTLSASLHLCALLTCFSEQLDRYSTIEIAVH